ncbi:hypothetical protein M8J77_014269 [Diaphorina citri]|nr:hypothetical protein M8J77_014269 [Diaphorina citri]
MGEELSTLLPSNQKVESFFQPGAGFKGVADVHTHSPHLMKPQANDSVVIYCGTNDVGRSEWNEIKAGLDILITKFKHCDRFCIIGVPLRFNTRKLNYHITNLNSFLSKFYTDSGRENSMSDPFRYGSPIPVLEPGFNRPPPENFGTPGRDTGT